MATMIVDLPDSMEEHKEHFEWFIRTMVLKLHVNRHKVFPVEGNKWGGLLHGLNDEHIELLQALHQQDQFGASIEAVDCANMAWLVSLWSCSITRKEFDEYTKHAPPEPRAQVHNPADGTGV